MERCQGLKEGGGIHADLGCWGPESETLKVGFLGRGRGWQQTGLEG